MADSVIVQMGDGVTSPLVSIKITQNVDGTFHFDITQSGNIVGDIRGLFFDIGNESLVSGSGTQASVSHVAAQDQSGGAINSISNSTVNNSLVDGNDSVTKAGGSDNNMNGALAFDGTGAEAKGYDVGMEFGTSGIGKDDVGAVSFDLKLTGLTLADLTGMDFGLRMTSVGDVDGSRDGSAKLTSLSFQPVDDGNETIGCVYEPNQLGAPIPAGDHVLTATGDLIADTVHNGNITVTQVLTSFTLDGHTYTFDAGHTSFTVDLTNTEGATATINQDGTFTIHSGGDELSANDHIGFEIDYTLHQTYQDQYGHVIGQLDDTSNATFSICGLNDKPVAQDDASGCPGPGQTDTGKVVFSDIDRGDTVKVTSWSDGDGHTYAAGDIVQFGTHGETVQLNDDGSWTVTGGSDTVAGYDEAGHFTYTVTDSFGATATANLDVEACDDPNGGGGNPPPDGPPPPATGGSPGAWAQSGGNPGDLRDSEGFAAATAGKTFDSFFNLDDLGPRTWGGNGGQPSSTYADLTLDNGQATSSIDFHGGSLPNLAGSEASLANQATAALANFYDTQSHDSFVAWYVYERANFDVAHSAVVSTADVLTDLVKQVHDAYDGVAGAYTLDQLTTLLGMTHEP